MRIADRSKHTPHTLGECVAYDPVTVPDPHSVVAKKRENPFKDEATIGKQRASKVRREQGRAHMLARKGSGKRKLSQRRVNRMITEDRERDEPGPKRKRPADSQPSRAAPQHPIVLPRLSADAQDDRRRVDEALKRAKERREAEEEEEQARHEAEERRAEEEEAATADAAAEAQRVAEERLREQASCSARPTLPRRSGRWSRSTTRSAPRSTRCTRSTASATLAATPGAVTYRTRTKRSPRGTKSSRSFFPASVTSPRPQRQRRAPMAAFDARALYCCRGLRDPSSRSRHPG